MSSSSSLLHLPSLQLHDKRRNLRVVGHHRIKLAAEILSHLLGKVKDKATHLCKVT